MRIGKYQFNPSWKLILAPLSIAIVLFGWAWEWFHFNVSERILRLTDRYYDWLTKK